MSITIMITDNRGVSSFVRLGAAPQGNDAATDSATDLKVWSTKRMTFDALHKLTRSKDDPDISFSMKALRRELPFGAELGDCLFEKPSRLCFSPKDSSDLMLVLSNFPGVLEARRTGKGRLIAGKTHGSLVPGAVEWDIIAVNEDISGRVEQTR